MKSLPIKPKVDAALLTFLSQFKPGDSLRTEDCIKYVKRHVTHYIYGDTVLRYMRQLKEDGKINYEIWDRKSRIMTII